MEKIYKHFLKISSNYRNIRTTDLEPILFFKQKLKNYKKIKSADVGCGAGRYDLSLFQNFGNKLHVTCIDVNEGMLKNLKEYLNKNKIKHFKIIKSSSGDLKLKSASLDCVFTFNAVHHFNLYQFINECLRVLKNKGNLFIYTRTRSQNKRNIWGEYFPLFYQKETRLYELNEFKKAFERYGNLTLQSIELFKYRRISSLNQLINKAKHKHYSTFNLYTKKEFGDSLSKFKKNIKRNFEDPKNITWYDENVLLHLKKK